MTEDMLLILAMSTDAFFAALSYSAGKIRIPAVSALIICAVSTIVLTLSAGLSSVLGSSGAVRLGFIGIIGFFQNGLKSILRRHQGKGKLSFCCFDIDFVISVYLDETQADSDMSKVLSPRESLALAAALSVDSVSGGFGAGLSGIHIIRLCILSFVFGIIAVSAGVRLGDGLKNCKKDFSWISGAFLIVLAFYKLFV